MQDNKCGFHRMEHVKLGTQTWTLPKRSSQSRCCAAGQETGIPGEKESEREGGSEERRRRTSRAARRSGSEQTWVTRPRTGGRRKGPGERKRRTNPGSKVRTGKGSQRRGDGWDEPPGHGRAREQREPLWQRPRPACGLPSAGAAALHSHLADELLPEVGAAPVGLGPGHVHPCGRRCRPRAPRRRCSSARRGGSTVRPLPAR